MSANPIDTNSDIDKIFHETIRVRKLQRGESKEGLVWFNVMNEPFALSFDYTSQRITQLLITERQRTCDLIEAEIPEKSKDSRPVDFKVNEVIDEVLAVIRRQRGASSRKDGSSPNDNLKDGGTQHERS